MLFYLLNDDKQNESQVIWILSILIYEEVQYACWSWVMHVKSNSFSKNFFFFEIRVSLELLSCVLFVLTHIERLPIAKELKLLSIF